MKLYNTGLLIGRFQMLHKGHVEMINKALDLCKTVVVFVGSAQEYGTEKNPFSFKVREGMFQEVFGGEINAGRLIVLPLDDIGAGDNSNWGDYVIHTYEQYFYEKPDLYITGCEKERPSWFSNTIAPEMDELRLSRHTIEVSASECRAALKRNDKEAWMKMVPYKLYSHYDYYRDIL